MVTNCYNGLRRPFSASFNLEERETRSPRRCRLDRRGKEKYVLSSTASQPQTTHWLSDHGPEELEHLLRAVVFHPTTPILLADNDRLSREASVGISKLLGVPRDKIIGRKLDDFAEQDFKPNLPGKWHAFLQDGQQEGTLELAGPDGKPKKVAYLAKSNILPVRHLLVLSEDGRVALRWHTRCKQRVGGVRRSRLGKGFRPVSSGCRRAGCSLVWGRRTHLRL